MQILELKKLIFLGLLGITAIIILILLIRPFFNTQLVVNTTPPVQEILIDDKPILPNKKAKQKSGKHNLVIKEYGFKKHAQEITVKKYGITKINIVLKGETKELLKDIPFEDPLLPFKIKGNYNSDNEPEYQVTIFVAFETTKEKREEIKGQAKKWLEERGVNEKNSSIKYFEDGE